MRVAFAMKLDPGQAEEYKRRHDQAWPELLGLLRAHGISNYTIHLHEPSHLLFAQLDVEDGERLELLPDAPLMRQWWDYMRDIMETDKSGRPVQDPLVELFHLP